MMLREKTRTTPFGALLREKRKAKLITLRKLADMIGVSPTYLSQVEQGHFAPPTANRVRRIARILGEDADLWIGLANRIPEDVEGLVKQHPTDMPELLRLVAGSTPSEFEAIKDAIRRIRQPTPT